MTRRKRWSYSAGERPHTVVVEEREVGGTLRVRAWDATKGGGKGGWVRRSLGHRDREAAKTYALERAAKLSKGDADLRQGKVTLGQVFALYKSRRTPRKSLKEQKADARRRELWTSVLGAGKDPHKVFLSEWERFIDFRTSGEIDARGKAVAEAERATVGTRSVEADLKWLRWVFNWAAKWRTAQGQYLMHENPVRGYEIPTEKNPRRPVASTDRYDAIRKISDQQQMEIRWNGKRETQRSYLSELLDIVNGTGRRISAVCQLRYEDLRLSEGPYGSIRWPADTDKGGRESCVPISPSVRHALDRVLRARPGIGFAPLFPKPTDRALPLSIHLASKWLREGEKLAGLDTQSGSLWHAYRRKWVTERKHLPDVDVAAAGGWKDTQALKSAYQQADTETMLRVVLEAGELREVR